MASAFISLLFFSSFLLFPFSFFNSFSFKFFFFFFSLCAKPPDRNRKKGQDLRYTFLNSSWHTDAKKIPEKLIYWRALACFFQNKISQKFFLVKTHLQGPKIGCSQK